MKKSEEQLGGERTILGSLDVKDAFLQVKQEAPTQVTTATGHFEVLRNLPGQRIGAKAWFDHLTEWLKSKGLQFCPENPCLGRAPLMCLLIHVDDIMFVGSMDYVMTEFIPEMKKAFDISEHHLKEDGSSFQFLRRTYEKVENGLRVHPGKYAESMVEAYGGKLGKTKFQKLPRGAEILEPDGTRYDLASLYRSLVGCGICLSQERLDVSYTVKELAANHVHAPTSASLKKLGKLIGCLKHRMGQHSLLELQETRTWDWCIRALEQGGFWRHSGAKGHRRSTSSAIHMVNGVAVATSSRGQKSVSLSSAEAELNALVSSAADGIYLRRCLEFLTGEEIEHCCTVDNSAALHLCIEEDQES